MSHSPQILLIDGNQQESDYFAHRLRTSLPDCGIIQTASGLSGLTLCERHPVECVVLEVDLPDMSGFEVLAKLVPRAQHPEIAVIVLTRLNNPHLLEVALKNGAQAALYKPMTSGDVLDKTIVKAISRVKNDRKRPTV